MSHGALLYLAVLQSAVLGSLPVTDLAGLQAEVLSLLLTSFLAVLFSLCSVLQCIAFV
jgi:hypothetical protein